MSKRFIYIFTVLITLLLLSSGLYGQSTTVSGIVIDSLTNEPLPFISTYFRGTQAGVTTDEEGGFSIKTSAPATELVVSSVGYKDFIFP
ncbi:MAG: carboxypeptidase-like regulatory domain-containing protein, partial [Bacteroidales bacterium]